MLAVVTALAVTFQNGDTTKRTSRQLPDSVPSVDLCQINGKYDHKLVRVRGLYRNDFEESSLSSPNCHVPHLTWVDFDDSYPSCTKERVRKKIDRIRKTNGQPSVDVVFVGRFEFGGDRSGGYGHLDQYLTRLVVTCVEDVRPLGSFRPLADGKR